MNWATIQEAIRTAVVSSVGIPDQRVQWMDTASAGQWRDSPLVDLVLKSPVAVGVDESRRKYNAGTDKLEWTQDGPRKFTVSVRIEAESQKTGEETVGTEAGNLRTRLGRPATRAAMRAGGVVLERMEPTVDADFSRDNRMVSLSITDVVFWAAESDPDPTASGDYIQHVGITGTLSP